MREGGIGIEHALCCSVRIGRRDTLDENLGLVEIEGEASVLPTFGTRVDDIVVFADSIAGVDATFEDLGAGADLRFAPQPPAARPAGGRKGVECF